MLEIEAKARLKDFKKLKEKILDMGGEYIKKEVQIDTYFNHPSRDFAKTDEALRVRKVGGDIFLAYKGPKLDKLTKTREEIEVKVGDLKKPEEILRKVGFREVLTIEKERECFRIKDLYLMLDDVKGLGKFVEIEKRADNYEPEEMVDFLKELGVDEGDIERKSYLELMLERRLL